MIAFSLQRWTLLVTVGTGLLLIAIDITILYTALPVLTRELGASNSEGLWIINAYPLLTAGLLLGAGTLGDRIGHRKMFLGGLVLFGLASFAAAFSPTPSTLIASRAFQAIGASAMMPATLALIRIAFDDERERNMAIAVWASLSLIGAVLGPLLGGVLLAHFWWGSIFLVNVPIVALTFLAAWFVAPHARPDLSRPWDLRSSIQILIALSSLVAAIKEMANGNPSWPILATTTILFFGAGTLFVRRQSRLAYPLVDFALFRNPAFLSGALGAAFVTFATGGLLLTIAQRYQWVAGYTPLQAGLLVSAIFLGTLPSSLLGAALVNRLGLRFLLAGGLAVASLGVLLVASGPALGLGWLIAGLTVVGTGLGATISVASATIVGNAPAHRAGMASSVEEVSYEFGSLFAVAILGSALAAIYSIAIEVPAGSPDAARISIADTLALAHENGANSKALIEAASKAFDQSFVMVMGIVAAVLLTGAALLSFLLRSTDGISTKSVQEYAHNKEENS